MSATTVPQKDVPPTSTQPTSQALPHASEEPAKALDQLAGEPSILDKAREMAKPYLDAVEETTRPYVEKVQATTKPYTDAAVARVEEIVTKIEGTHVSAQPETTEGLIAEHKRDFGLDGASTTTSATDSTPLTGGAGQDVAGQAKGMLEQVTSAVQNTFDQISNTIEGKTAAAQPATNTQPPQSGIMAQVTDSLKQGAAKVESLLDDRPEGTGAGASGIPPVQTTTNTQSQASSSI